MYNFRIKIANFFAEEYIRGLKDIKKQSEADAIAEINTRVAEVVSKMDPFEPVMKLFNGVFSKEYERPEDSLSEQHKVTFYMWAYRQIRDPDFLHLIDWVTDNAGNTTMKRASPLTAERAQYGRAQIANMLLLKKEVGRLSSLYEDILEKNKEQKFDPSVSVD